MLYGFTKGFLKSQHQVFESFVYIFPIISIAMTGLAFTFFFFTWECENTKGKQ